MKYFKKVVKENDINKPLINEISEYVNSILDTDIDMIPYSSYKNFYKDGSRKEFEKAYFERRKKLTALGLYLQWNNSEKARDYFEELLWAVSNEFSWCLSAHLSYKDDKFANESKNTIDLFASETAETLCELLIIHEDKIDTLLSSHIKNQIEERVIKPFLNKTWEFERANHNWSAVCCGCIGIVALLMENTERQKLILPRVEKSLDCYLSGFYDDGAALEGIGYWSYGFGYYMYYQALKNELLESDSACDKDILNNDARCDIDKINNDFPKNTDKVKAIASFPERVQISEKRFLPFSDVPPDTTLPSGLVSYLHDKFNIKAPFIKRISSFDFDHCFRWAHVSRNLWWTTEDVLNKDLDDTSCYFKDAGWVSYRRNNMFFGIKGGSNNEPHNHNDIGSFVIAVNGELLLTDLGAGAYTKDYFGDKRYTYPHTRSYYHSVPYINGHEQDEIQDKVAVTNNTTDSCLNYTFDLSTAYKSSRVNKLYRNVTFKSDERKVILTDDVSSNVGILLNEGFISYVKPEVVNVSQISLKSEKGQVVIIFDCNKFIYEIEKAYVINHYNEKVPVYRLSFTNLNRACDIKAEFKFYIKQ